MKRRTFIKDMAVGGLMVSFPAGLMTQEGAAPKLAQVTGEDPALITKEAVAILGGMARFVSRGCSRASSPCG